MTNSNHSDGPNSADLLRDLSARFPSVDFSEVASRLGIAANEIVATDPDAIGADEDVMAIVDPSSLDNAETLCRVLAELASDTAWLEQGDPFAWRDETTREALYLCAEITRQLGS